MKMHIKIGLGILVGFSLQMPIMAITQGQLSKVNQLKSDIEKRRVYGVDIIKEMKKIGLKGGDFQSPGVKGLVQVAEKSLQGDAYTDPSGKKSVKIDAQLVNLDEKKLQQKIVSQKQQTVALNSKELQTKRLPQGGVYGGVKVEDADDDLQITSTSFYPYSDDARIPVGSSSTETEPQLLSWDQNDAFVPSLTFTVEDPTSTIQHKQPNFSPPQSALPELESYTSNTMPTKTTTAPQATSSSSKQTVPEKTFLENKGTGNVHPQEMVKITVYEGKLLRNVVWASFAGGDKYPYNDLQTQCNDINLSKHKAVFANTNRLVFFDFAEIILKEPFGLKVQKTGQQYPTMTSGGVVEVGENFDRAVRAIFASNDTDSKNVRNLLDTELSKKLKQYYNAMKALLEQYQAIDERSLNKEFAPDSYINIIQKMTSYDWQSKRFEKAKKELIKINMALTISTMVAQQTVIGNSATENQLPKYLLTDNDTYSYTNFINVITEGQYAGNYLAILTPHLVSGGEQVFSALVMVLLYDNLIYTMQTSKYIDLMAVNGDLKKIRSNLEDSYKLVESIIKMPDWVYNLYDSTIKIIDAKLQEQKDWNATIEQKKATVQKGKLTAQAIVEKNFDERSADEQKTYIEDQCTIILTLLNNIQQDNSIVTLQGPINLYNNLMQLQNVVKSEVKSVLQGRLVELMVALCKTIAQEIAWYREESGLVDLHKNLIDEKSIQNAVEGLQAIWNFGFNQDKLQQFQKSRFDIENENRYTGFNDIEIIFHNINELGKINKYNPNAIVPTEQYPQTWDLVVDELKGTFAYFLIAYDALVWKLVHETQNEQYYNWLIRWFGWMFGMGKQYQQTQQYNSILGEISWVLESISTGIKVFANIIKSSIHDDIMVSYEKGSFRIGSILEDKARELYQNQNTSHTADYIYKFTTGKLSLPNNTSIALTNNSIANSDYHKKTQPFAFADGYDAHIAKIKQALGLLLGQEQKVVALQQDQSFIAIRNQLLRVKVPDANADRQAKDAYKREVTNMVDAFMNLWSKQPEVQNAQ